MKMSAMWVFGERGRNRTYNLLIKSQLLCQLSYAPGRTDKGRTTFDYNIASRVTFAPSKDPNFRRYVASSLLR